MRTLYKIFIDFNPSEEYHWLYDTVIPRDDCDFFKSTYLDNPFFLTRAQWLQPMTWMTLNYADT